ncbi:MAG: hypothetical protein ACRDRM_13195 [Pseudonocardiaceae bacterium]
MPTQNPSDARNDHTSLLQRSSHTRHPSRVALGPLICRTCHLERTPQERRCDDLLVGECRECHDPSL